MLYKFKENAILKTGNFQKYLRIHLNTNYLVLFKGIRYNLEIFFYLNILRYTIGIIKNYSMKENDYIIKLFNFSGKIKKYIQF